MKWFQDSTYTLEAAAVTGALISMVIKAVLFWGLSRLVCSFGQGLRERSEYTAFLFFVSSRSQNRHCMWGNISKMNLNFSADF